jgi:monoamine oxidase
MEQGKTYTFKLNSGEELIAKVAEITRDNIIISDPVSIAPAQGGMQMIPSLFTAEPGSNVTLNTNSVAMFSETEDGIKMKYIEATTGIKIPEKKLILG